MSKELKRLVINDIEYEIFDDAARNELDDVHIGYDGETYETAGEAVRTQVSDLNDRIDTIEASGGSSGDGLSVTEKNLILTLFSMAAYADDGALDVYTSLQNLFGSFVVTWVGDGYTRTNKSTGVKGGSTFTSRITAKAGFEIDTVSATMGGETLSGIFDDGMITIPDVSGDIVITVTTSTIPVVSLNVSYEQSQTIYTNTPINNLKSDLHVEATYYDSTTSVISANDYTLSGTLSVGTSEVTVEYEGQTATFNVVVSEWSTAPEIIQSDTYYNTSGNLASKEGVSITKRYLLKTNMAAAKASAYYDSANNYFTQNGVLYKIRLHTTNSTGMSGVAVCKHVVSNSRGEHLAYMSPVYNAETAVMQSNRQNSGFVTDDGCFFVGFSLLTPDIDNCYAYIEAGSYLGLTPEGYAAGDILFAGRNTPYWGKTNISEV